MSQVEHKETIYILDQITAKPGKAKELLAAYMERYAPAAKEERGMTLVSRWITPPMWMNEQDDQGNTLFITWSILHVPTECEPYVQKLIPTWYAPRVQTCLPTF